MSALKEPEQRRNRGKPVRGEVRPSPGWGWQHGPTPPCPPGLHRETQAAWRAWMAGFAVANLFPADLPALRVVAKLHSAVSAGDLVRMTELRLWMDLYGLTPRGLQQRRWKAPEPAEAPAEASKGAYRDLRVVDDGS